MTENGNKGGSRLLAIMLFSALIAAALFICATIEYGTIFRSAYDDPELSPVLIRGNILDRNGEYLAIQAPDYGFQIHLRDASAQEAAAYISGYTEENAISIGNKIENGAEFIRITDLLEAETFSKIEKDLRDFSLSDDITPVSVERRRLFFRSAAAIVGETGDDLHGISGIEKLFDSQLSAVPEPDSAISHGEDITLTIDIGVQQLLYDAAIITDRDAEAAIISPDGEVLALYGTGDEAILRCTVNPEPFPYGTYSARDGYRVYVKSISKTASMRAMLNTIIARTTAEL